MLFPLVGSRKRSLSTIPRGVVFLFPVLFLAFESSVAAGLESPCVLPIPPSLGLACKLSPALVYPTAYGPEAAMTSPKSSVSFHPMATWQFMKITAQYLLISCQIAILVQKMLNANIECIGTKK